MDNTGLDTFVFSPIVFSGSLKSLQRYFQQNAFAKMILGSRVISSTKGKHMIKKWLNNIMPTKKSKQKIKGVYHHIPLDFNNHAALKVLEQLHRSGYEAYLVGGAVRDLLLGVQPKDFDIATNARPEQVSKIFRRSRIIGRRFQIVHVMVGSETIEVSTFRSGGRVKQNEFGRIMQDNAYGTLEQDAMRRDFTCNALYYDIHTHQIIDFHNGLNDVKARKIVMIGDPAERYHEDRAYASRRAFIRQTRFSN